MKWLLSLFKKKKPVERHKNYKDVEHERLVKLMQEHKDASKVGEILGVSRSTVYRRLKEYGNK